MTSAYTKLTTALQQHAIELHETLLRERAQRSAHERAALELEESRRTELLAQVAAGLVHDVNNSLFIIMAAADGIVRLEEDGRSVSALAESIEDTARTTSDLVSELLSLRRNESTASQVVVLGPLVTKLARIHFPR